MFNKIMIISLIFIALLSSFVIYAEDIELNNIDDKQWLETQEVEAIFTDVNSGDEFYEAVMTMNKLGIIEGYGDNNFKPLKLVNREEFAVMMVKALKLEIKEQPSTFVDVADGYWASKYIEAAKNYITGYSRNGEYLYKPKENAVREDMAVALVVVLKKSISTTGLETYVDKDKVSKNLLNYVSSAIDNKLMIGYEEDGQKFFNPLGTLTRAETAVLLLKIVNEEKIVFNNEEKVVMQSGEFNLDVVMVENGVELVWEYQTDSKIDGYKVVASKNNPNPVYPTSGYAKAIDETFTIVNNGDIYKDGDFSYFEAGEEYYFAITALIGDGKVSSSVKKIKMPDAVTDASKVPVVKVSQVDDGIFVEWSAINKTGLQGYRIVASKFDKTAVYPENGYAKWITDLDKRDYFIESYSNYNGGDLGGSFKPGETYYISVTAVYNFGKIAGNTITYVMPGEKIDNTLSTKHETPEVSVTVVDDHLLVEWNTISLEGLEGYKIVASKKNPNPVYSADGYAKFITNLSSRSFIITKNTKYNGGDLDSNFKPGEKYYISVTAIYSNSKIPGNAIRITMPE